MESRSNFLSCDTSFVIVCQLVFELYHFEIALSQKCARFKKLFRRTVEKNSGEPRKKIRVYYKFDSWLTSAFEKIPPPPPCQLVSAFGQPPPPLLADVICERSPSVETERQKS